MITRLSKNLILKRLVAFVFILVAVVGLFPPSTAYADTDSNTKRRMLLDFAKSKDITEISGIESFSASELFMLGVYLSNFYVPFKTSISEANTNNTLSKCRDDMISALVDSANFSKKTAETVVDACLSVSQGGKNGETVRSLGLYEYNKDSGTAGKQILKNISYSNFMYYFGKEDRKETKFDMCLAWENDGEIIPVLDTVDSTFTASTLSYILTNGGLDYENGYGSAMLGYSSAEEAFEEAGKADKDAILSMLPWKQYLYIDAFGNILIDYGIDRFVVLPACQNPYVFADKDGNNVGKRLNLISLHMLQLMTEKKIYGSVQKGKSKYQYTFVGSENTTSLYNTNHWRVSRGSSKTDIDSNWFFGNGTAGKLLDIIKDNKPFDKGFARLTTFKDGKNDKVPFYDWKYYKDNKKGIGATINTVESYDSLVIFDTLDMFKSADSTDSFKTLPTGLLNPKNSECIIKKNDAVFGGYGKTINKLSGSDAQLLMCNIYATYVLGLLGDERVEFTFNTNGFPTIPSDFSFNLVMDIAPEDDTTLSSMAYWFLHPKKGISFVSEWVRNKVTGVIVSQHSDMVGKSSNSALIGTTRYIGFSGYVTTPTLSDVSWIDAILIRYNSIMGYMIILIIIVMLSLMLVGTITKQKAFLNIVVFSFCVMLPPVVIDTCINVGNTVSDRLYSTRFIYWGVVQHQAYLNQMDSVSKEENYSDYLTALMQEQLKSNDALAGGVTLKWMTPKKDNYAEMVQKSLEEKGASVASSSLLRGMVAKNFSNETYLDNSDALYLYRTYTDIANYARYVNNSIARKSNKCGSTGTVSMNTYRLSNKGFKSSGEAAKRASSNLSKMSSYINSGLRASINKGFTRDSGEGKDKSQMTRFYSMLGSNDLLATIKKVGSLDKTSDYSKVGIRVPEGMTLSAFSNNKVNANTIAVQSFFLHAESPYYYFNWNLVDQGMSLKSEVNTGFDKLMLSGRGDYFFNQKLPSNQRGYNEMRDYTDMKSLFSIVIPYLKMCNDVVEEWETLYGLETYKGVRKLTDLNKLKLAKNDKKVGANEYTSDEYKKAQHNYIVEKLWNIYSPWVDTMYDCKYAQPTKVKVLGKYVLITDPLNPYSYPSERPMVFSKSEQLYYGISDSDLTPVERKIQNIQKETYKDLYDLSNYYTLSDVVLTSASAMLTTFNFNKEFSESNLFSSDYTMYPQSFELKNFSYDAFLRMILSNSTGESLQGDTSLYERVIKNSSVFTGIALLINDVLAIYVVSGLKLFFLVAIFFISIVMVFAGVLDIEGNLMKTFFNSFLTPLLMFIGVTIGHSVIISAFLGTGASEITGGSAFSIQLGDPALTIMVMIVIHIVVVVLYFRLCKRVACTAKSLSLASVFTMAGAIGGVVMHGASIVSSASGKTLARGVVGRRGGTVSGTYSAGTADSEYVTKREERESDRVQRKEKRSNTRKTENRHTDWASGGSGSKSDNSTSIKTSQEDFNRKTEEGKRNLERKSSSKSSSNFENK